MNSSFKEIGQRLKHYMQQRGLTVNKLAHATQLPAKKIVKIIDGKSYSLQKVLLIMEVLSDISQVWLLTGGGEMVNNAVTSKKEKSPEAKKSNESNTSKESVKQDDPLLKQVIKNQEKLLKQNNKIIRLLEKK